MVTDTAPSTILALTALATVLALGRLASTLLALTALTTVRAQGAASTLLAPSALATVLAQAFGLPLLLLLRRHLLDCYCGEHRGELAAEVCI